MRERLVELAGGRGSHVSVPVQGSGTFAIEATVGTLVARDGSMEIPGIQGYQPREQTTCMTAPPAPYVTATAAEPSAEPSSQGRRRLSVALLEEAELPGGLLFMSMIEVQVPQHAQAPGTSHTVPVHVYAGESRGTAQ